jgi:hypothetical protein
VANCNLHSSNEVESLLTLAHRAKKYIPIILEAFDKIAENALIFLEYEGIQVSAWFIIMP